MSFKLFPAWRDLWCELPGIQESLTQAEAMIEARSTGRSDVALDQCPQITDDVEKAIRAAIAWSADVPPPRERAGNIARHIHGQLAPGLDWGKWARWAELERCFLDASATGDVLFGATALRTMIEEVGRLTALDLNANALADLAEGDQQQQARLRRYMGAAWTSLSTLTDQSWLKHPVVNKVEKRIELINSSKEASGRLNGFVHPNYGSHMAVLYPEGQETASVLIEGVIAVYTQFNSLSEVAKAPAPLPAASALSETRQALLTSYVDDTLKPIVELLEASPFPPLIDLQGVTADLTQDPLASFLESNPVPDVLVDMLRTIDGSEHGFRSWRGALLHEVVLVAQARQSEQSLSVSYTAASNAAEGELYALRE